MAELLRRYDNRNQPLVGPEPDVLSLVYFNLVHLRAQEQFEYQLAGFETVVVVLSGECVVSVDGREFLDVGRRQDMWSGRADSVYAPSGSHVHLICDAENTEIAVGEGRCEQSFQPFRILPEEAQMVDVGSEETHSRRQIFHILGHNANGRAGNWLVSELYGSEGCWAGYPLHKHNTENPPSETCFEELYHYHFRPENDFGAQLVFDDDGASDCYMTRSGDTFLVDRGYHPNVTSPGHQQYIFTVLVGKHQRSLVRNFEAEYRYLMSRIPGIAAMREKFK